jgi:Cd2+/Zn2+-exporting ATPase
MVNEAQAQKSTTQHFAEKFERWFVPLVIGLVVILIFAWVVIDEPFAASFYRAMAVLVGASPCALAISTPSAVLSGVARAARGGVLVKGGGPLEDLGNVRAIAFDKTGTLTQGRPELTDVVPLHDTSKLELLQIAVAVEALSDHPLASAIVRDGSKLLAESPGEPLTPRTTKDNGLVADRDGAENLVSVTGRGVTATVRGATAQIGKDVWFLESDPAGLPTELSEANAKLKENGRTTMIVKWQGRFLGVLGLMDQPRVDAREMLDRLRGMGIERMIMISGDNQKVADAVANAVGLDEAWGDLMPSDKVDAIRRLRDEMSVAMVGDGVNDAPAMANATVGIAMGAAGSDVALETADVALMADNLNHLPFAIGLSRMTNQIIRQNVWFSLGMVLFLIPAAILGLKMGPAVALHEGSTLVVVLNALRLLGFKMPGKIE